MTTTTNTDSVHLIGIGKHVAKSACSLRPGDVIVWNYGSESKVVSVKISASGKTTQTNLLITDGSIVPRRFSADRLVAVLP